MCREEIQTVEQMVHCWGCPLSEAVLDSCSYFQTPELEGVIGYRLSNRYAVVLGDPICPPEKKMLLAEAFQKFCQEHQLSCIYFLVSEKFAKWAVGHHCKILLEVGEEIIFKPQIDPTIGHRGSKLRNKIHHAQHQGLSVKEYLSSDPELEKKILDVGKKWVKARKGPQIYLGNLNFFENRLGKRWFYLQDEKQNILGMALLCRLDAHGGWLLKFLIIIPGAPRGSSELLMVSLLEVLRQEECRFLTYGIVPADYLGEISGLGKINALLAKMLFKIAKWVFRLSQKKLYWRQFQPHTESSYLLFSSSSIGIEELRALAVAIKMEYKK